MATMRARVELRGSLTHQAPASAGGRLMKRGSPVIMTDPAQIQYYRSQGGFSVSMLEAKKPAPAPAAPSEPAGGEGSEGGHTEAELKKMKKAQLVEIAEGLGLETDGATVAELIDGILEAQAGEG